MSDGHEIQGSQRAKKTPKPDYYVMIKFKNNPKATKLFVKSKTPKTMEAYLKNHLHLWENAHLGNSITGYIYHYYHPSRYMMRSDQHRLTREQYRNIYRQSSNQKRYCLCIIHTTKYKRQTQDYKFKGAVVESLEEVSSYWNKNVLRIDIRVDKQLINSYDENGFRHPIAL